jgi:hypothetical protein
MVTVREPVLKPVPIAELRPTQITLGLREVEDRRKRWRALKKKKMAFLGTHMIPAILGPKERYYIIDHHHLVRALHEEGVKDVLVIVTADLHKLDQDAFWIVLDNRDLMHPFDAKGQRRPYSAIPKTVRDMVDDPFRSLAGALRRVGGYSKETTPFSEFLWADFLRRRLKAKKVRSNFTNALKESYKLAKSHEASYLPGWCGPAHDD